MGILKLLLESYKDLFTFQDIEISIDIKHIWATKEIHKSSGYNGAGLAKFETDVYLWRVFDEEGLIALKKNKRVTSGTFSVSIERKFGPQFTGSLEDAMIFGKSWKNSGRLKGELYIIGINGIGRDFMVLDLIGRLEKQNLEYKRLGDNETYTVKSDIGDSGLGYSIIGNILFKDIKYLFKYNTEDDKLIDITDQVIQ